MPHEQPPVQRQDYFADPPAELPTTSSRTIPTMLRRRSSALSSGKSMSATGRRSVTPQASHLASAQDRPGPPPQLFTPATGSIGSYPSSASSSTVTVVSQQTQPDMPPPVENPPPTRPGASEGGLLRQGSVLVRKAPAMVVRELVKDYRNDMIAMVGEFVGTVLFLMLSLGSVQSLASNIEMGNESSNPHGDLSARIISNYYKAAAFGFALFATASIFYRFTGSIFNPSVSLALCIIGAMRPARFFMVSLAQILGGIAASYLVHALLPGEPQYNLYLASGTSIVQGLFIEMFATITLVMNVLMQGAEKHVMTPHAPLGFGITMFVIVLFSVEYTGCGINVARAFGSACVMGFTPYHWIYWLGPTLGSLLAVGCYALLRAIRYWDINPGQDATQPLDQPKDSRRDQQPPERAGTLPV